LSVLVQISRRRGNRLSWNFAWCRTCLLPFWGRYSPRNPKFWASKKRISRKW